VYAGPRPPTDADLLSWWHTNHYEPATRFSFRPDDQLLIVPRACLAAFAQELSSEELGASHAVSPEMRVAEHADRRGVRFELLAMPCVLAKHAAHKAAFGRSDVRVPRMTIRTEPLD
jgi:hypothetical protein